MMMNFPHSIQQLRSSRGERSLTILNNKCFLLLIFVILTGLCQASLKEEAETLIQNKVKDCPVKFKIYTLSEGLKKQIELKAKQKFFRSELYMWEWNCSSSNQGIAFVDNALGKDLPITYLGMFNPEGQLIYTTILKYRESYGGEVTSKNWLGGFFNKNADSNFIPGQGIDVISGATISVHSVSKGFFKLALLAKEIFHTEKPLISKK